MSKKKPLSNLEIVRLLRPIDDDFMRELFRDRPKLTEYVLRIILNKSDLKVESQETQYDLKIIGSRSLELDIKATDSENKQYDVEIERTDSRATALRARYHLGAMDVDSLDSGDDFDKLPETYVIFICENDVRKGGKPIYSFKRFDEFTNELFEDKQHILFINGAYKNENDTSDLAKLIHDFKCNKSEDMLLEPMSRATYECKETTKGESAMCKLVEDWKKDVAEYYAEQAARESLEQVAFTLIDMGTMSYEQIAQATKLPLERVRELAEGKTA